jgi:SAM-dependent methyltransferase
MCVPAEGADRQPKMDRHSLYEAAVQDAEQLCSFLERLHGAGPARLGEDCCGTALLARTFVARAPGRSAVALDLDPQVLARAAAPGLTCIQGDLRDRRDLPACDLVHLGNFSVGYLRSRAELLEYLRRTRRRLAPGGVLTLDTYGGARAYQRGVVERRRALPDGTVVEARFERVECDPLRARVVDHLHLRRVLGAAVLDDHPRAFTYEWRLWTPMELAEAVEEAGYATWRWHAELGAGREGASGADLDDEWVVLMEVTRGPA